MFFINGTTTDNYIRYDLGGNSHFMLANDSVANLLSFSENGQTELGFLYGEIAEFRDANLQTIFIKSRSAGLSCNFRLWAYGQKNVVYPVAQSNQVNFSPDIPNVNELLKLNGVLTALNTTLQKLSQKV